jgi:tetratricopeptide (TPR) repeat protein
MRGLRLVIVGLMIPILSASLFAQRTNPNSSGPSSITPSQGSELQIQVVWPNDHPLQEVIQLQLQNGSGVPVADGFTNTEGIAVFHSVRTGTYRLRVSGINIVETTTENITVFRNEAVHMEYVRVARRAGSPDNTAQGGMVSANDMNVPEKARKEMDTAMGAMQKNDMATATEHLNKAVQIYPQYARAWNNLGVIRMKAGDKVGASAAWELAVAADDKLAPACLNLARIAISDQQLVDAEKLIEKALASDPSNASALFLMATAQAMNGQWADALISARKVHTIVDHRHFADAHRIAAEALMQLDQPQDALAEYDTYLKENPESGHADQVREAMSRLQAHLQVMAK